MVRHQLIFLVALFLLCCNVQFVRGISRCNQFRLASASLPQYRGSSHPRSRQSSTIIGSSRRGSRNHYGNARDDNCLSPDDPFLEETLPVARSKQEKKTPKKESARQKKESKQEKTEPDDPFAEPMTSTEIYSHLGPVGKCVAGSVEIAVSTCMEYMTGFLGGYVLGSITDVPQFAFKQVDKTQQFPFFQELTKRYGRMHAKSFRWAKSWGGISAAFGGFRVATRVIRGGKEDEWNTVFSSAAAGAFFARKEGPKGMLRGAITYGGMMYLLSGGLLSGKKEPFEYREQPIDF